MKVSSVKHLGLILDNKFNFSKHVDKITSLAYKTLGFMGRSGKDNTIYLNLSSSDHIIL